MPSAANHPRAQAGWCGNPPTIKVQKNSFGGDEAPADTDGGREKHDDVLYPLHMIGYAVKYNSIPSYLMGNGHGAVLSTPFSRVARSLPAY
jgi:hypothetical protein